MESKVQHKLRFTGIDFPHVNVNSSKRVEKDNNDDINVNIKPVYFTPKDNAEAFLIIMNVNVGIPDYIDISLTAIGNFLVTDSTQENDVRKQFINVNAPAIMFPYIRAFISSLTSNLGSVTKPIILPPRFFHGEIEEFEDEQID